MVICVYGNCGIGKTIFAGTSCSLGKDVYYVDANGGSSSLNMVKGHEKIKRVRVTSIQEYVEYHNNMDFRDSVLIIDHIGDIQDLALDNCRGKKPGRGQALTVKPPSQPMWRLVNALIKDIVRELIDFSETNNNIVLIIAQEGYNEESHVIAPEIAGKLAKWVPATVDCTGRLTMKDGERILQIKDVEDDMTGATITAKSRLTSEMSIEKPNMIKLLKIIGGKSE